jgi:O-antigen/teichoic acid export membrane protein
MKKKIYAVLKHPLISGSTIVLVGSMAANILSYFFNLAMGRFLAPPDYGALISLVSVFNIFSVFSVTISTVFTKYSATLSAQKNEKYIGHLFISGIKLVGVASILIVGLIVVFSSRISSFLNINSPILVDLIGFSLFFSYLWFVGYGILQGILKFTYISLIGILSSLVKLILGLVFVSLGFKVMGAMNAILLAAIVPCVLVIIPLYRFVKSNINKNFPFENLRKKLSSYAVPVFLSNIGVTAFIIVDIILVKHFFNPTIAGQYAAISTMGRSIFFVVAPIGLVLFPLIAQKNEKRESISGTVLLSAILVGVPSILLSLVYVVFPDLIRSIFYPLSVYKPVDKYLGQFSIFILFYSFSYLLNTIYLSIGRVWACAFAIGGCVLEIVLISLFHKDIGQVINVMIISSFLLLISLLLYYPKAVRDSKS